MSNDLIKTAAPPNPRTLKRVLNVLALQVPIRGGDDDEARRLAKVILMQVVFDDAYQLLRKDPLLIKQFEQGAGGHNAGIVSEPGHARRQDEPHRSATA